ncbi:MAG: ATP-dependent helicase HrpB [Bacteroidales bacterium]|nr:ATP-dependent helicase HrpB [Bacteroidales bacterium]
MDISRVMERAGKLPVAEIAGTVGALLGEHACLVVTAPPGAGKSTLLPITILEDLSEGKILMLEPRRLAARQIAERMAWLLGEPVGRTSGYRIRFESKVSSSTRIEVLTEGILTRMIEEDPTLEGVSAVIFDEFHERSLNSDLALALTRETQSQLRPDLKIVIMSATIDTDTVCRELDAPLVEGKGKMFPVQIISEEPEATEANAAEAVARAVRKAHREQEGDILAFLPGEADIRRCVDLLGETLGGTEVHPLYGMLPPEAQRRAIAPGANRKVVLATPIAETSLTIENVRIVVDSGLCRKPVFDPQSGLSRLETVRISRDMARQRTGRAGRVAPGVCYRLWGPGTEARMEENRKPEILEADLSQTMLSIASWGGGEAESMPWLTPPPAAALRQARGLLATLGAVGEGGITAIGRRMAALPCHPRISHMLVKAQNPEEKALAADIAALLEEKDPMALDNAGTDMGARVSALRRARREHREGRAWGRIARVAEQYRSLTRCAEDNTDPDPYSIGTLVAAAYPERIAKAHQDGCGRFLLACGDMAFTDRDDPMSAYEWLAVASLNVREGADGRIFLAAPLDPDDLGDMRTERDNVAWDSRRGTVVAQRETRIGGLVVAARPISDIPREKVDRIICEAAARDGRSMLDFSDEVGNLQRRVAAVAAWHPELGLPDLSTDSVLKRANEWLQPFLGKAISTQELKKIDLMQALWTLLDYTQQQAVERLAPSHIAVPTGSRIRVEYRQGAELPVLRVRLQECFGLTDTPKVDDGRRPVLMELLSPGFKPVQLTQDLHSFWENTYFEVRKELRRRYPKHSWPDNPLEAPPVRGTGRHPTNTAAPK